MNPLLESYPTATNRDKILLSAFNEMYQHGYQGMRIEAVLKATVSKSAARARESDRGLTQEPI